MNTDSATRSTNESMTAALDAPPPAATGLAPGGRPLDDLDLALPPTTKKTRDALEEEMMREYLRVLPHAAWALIEVESARKVSDILEVNDLPSPFAKVVAMGPDFGVNVEVGDRVTYSQCVGLPDELKGTKWAKRFRWMSNRQFMGRQPRFEGEKMLEVTAVTKTASAMTLEEEVHEHLKYAKKKWVELCAKWGVNPDDPNLRFGPGGPTTTSGT